MRAVPDESLPELLRARMAALGISTYQEMADALGVSQPTVSKWLGGDAPGDDKAPQIATFLGLDVDDVLPVLFRAREEARARRPRRDAAFSSLREQSVAQRIYVKQAVAAFLANHGFHVSIDQRDAGVDLVARREDEIIGIEIKKLGGPKNTYNRIREAIASFAIFDQWTHDQGTEQPRMVLFVDEPVPATNATLLRTLEHLGGEIIHDDLDALLNPRRRRVSTANFGVSRREQPGNTPFLAAAHEGDPAAPSGRRTRRPQPEPEPDDTP